MENFNLNFKKASILFVVLNFNSLNTNAAILFETISDKNKSNTEINIDGLFKRKKIKTNKSPNYSKKRNKPSPISQYNLRNQSKSTLKSIKRNKKRHFSNKKALHHRHRRHAFNF